MTEMVELLSQLLIQLSSQDNKCRQEAEQQLDQHWVINQPAHLLVGLAHLVASHPDAYVRKKEMWTFMSFTHSFGLSFIHFTSCVHLLPFFCVDTVLKTLGPQALIPF